MPTALLMSISLIETAEIFHLKCLLIANWFSGVVKLFVGNGYYLKTANKKNVDMWKIILLKSGIRISL